MSLLCLLILFFLFDSFIILLFLFDVIEVPIILLFSLSMLFWTKILFIGYKIKQILFPIEIGWLELIYFCNPKLRIKLQTNEFVSAFIILALITPIKYSTIILHPFGFILAIS